MAIAIFSDIHGNDEALLAILKDCKKRKIKQIYFLGDAISIGPSSKNCLEILEKFNVQCCIGNHEQRMFYYSSEITSPDWSFHGRRHMQIIFRSLDNNNLKFMKSMKLQMKISYKKYKLFLTHFPHDSAGSVLPDFDQFSEKICARHFDKENCDVCFYGHIHERNIIINNEGKAYVCVGSSGISTTNKTFYTLFDVQDDNYVIKKIPVEYNQKALWEKMSTFTDPALTMFNKKFGAEHLNKK